MATGELGIPNSANALARHTLQFLRLYAIDNVEEWRGETDISTWSSSCERIYTTSGSTLNFQCDLRALQMCFTYKFERTK